MNVPYLLMEQFTVEVYLSFSSFLVVMNKVTDVKFWWEDVSLRFLGLTLWSGIAGSGRYAFNFIGNYQTGFQSGCKFNSH